MGFTVNDLQDLIRVLEENPQWRAQLRPVILGEEFDRLPGIVQALAEAQQRTADNLAGLTARVDQLVEAQQRTDARIDQLVQAQLATEARVSELADRIDQLADKVDRLATTVEVLSIQFADDTGALNELRFERKAASLFGEWLRKPRVLSLNDLDRFDEAEMAGELSHFETRQLRAMDIIIQGFDKREAGYPDTLLAIEVSRTLEEMDIERAESRAELLTRIGYRALPAVGGRFAGERVMAEAEKRGVLLRLIDQV